MKLIPIYILAAFVAFGTMLFTQKWDSTNKTNYTKGSVRINQMIVADSGYKLPQAMGQVK